MIPLHSFEILWHALPTPAMMLDDAGRIAEVNTAAESFFAASNRQLGGRQLDSVIGEDSRMAELVRLVMARGTKMSEYDIELSWPELPTRLVDLHAAAISQAPGGVVVMIHPRAIAETMDRSLSHRNAARSIAGMSAMLAHEIRNPLAGISGAAQLLEMNADAGDKELATLIREEADRIGALMARVEQFGEIGPSRLVPVNIHDVLDRACRSAKAGFAAHLRFVEEYDPSLPPTMGDADQLIQVILNLLKNAAEAAPQVGGTISIRTAYRVGMKVATPTGRRESLPLQITITDNGPGVPEELLRHIFEPFVSSKQTGSGLGLALVSKIVADHGGIIACDSEPGRTRFRLSLPVASADDLADETNMEEDVA
jgi:two-component system nitrogen regulation sensor histidine kinase GlnL